MSAACRRCYKTYPVPSLASPKLSQYTLRYRYVTGSGLRPDTRKGQNQKRLAGGCAHCVITTTPLNFGRPF
ncbi:hypothetical protein C5952_23260 [Cronobacter sakazakii]|nr:hypothetical protein C5952_23260 [Cronobacter sakazakii]PQX69974.1 hypothetical protein C5975_21040 [Cronobacter sakazakii]PQY09556.1 hypothetical protein C5941_20915 [Cronobacter sakazakii]PQY75283.1 hypothetical protein C5966_21925 [Cronobacter sakazakii]PQZ37208.1 hypothetical protein C5976_20855 [Cronobacter sakazakii]